jgi:hypothetical protein
MVLQHKLPLVPIGDQKKPAGLLQNDVALERNKRVVSSCASAGLP